MKVKAEYCDKIGRFIYTYKFTRKTTNKLAESDIISLNNLVRYYCDNGHAVIENEEIRRLLDENTKLKRELESYIQK